MGRVRDERPSRVMNALAQRTGIALLLLGVGGAVLAQDALPPRMPPGARAREYFHIRDASASRRRPGAPGALTEIRGRLGFFSRMNPPDRLSVGTADGKKWTAFRLPPGTTLAGWPALAPGAQVRVLCRAAATTAHAGGPLVLVGAIGEKEALRYERELRARGPAPAAPPRREGAGRPAAAGASTPRRADSARFIPTLREQHPGLGAAAAKEVAAFLLEECARRRVDPALALAVLAEENGLRESAAGPGKFIGMMAAAKSTVVEVVSDLGRRIPNTGARTASPAALRRALVGRAAARGRGMAGSDEEYAANVLRRVLKLPR